MRAGLAAMLLFLSAAGCHGPGPRSAASEIGPLSPLPSWAPPYSSAQLALLKPVSHPIQVRAKRIIPALDRFEYGRVRRMKSPEDGLKLSKLVATVLQESPRFYALDEASPELSNPVLQYGPPGPSEPDGWMRARVDGDGKSLGAVDASSEARVAYARGKERERAGDLKAAIEAFQQAVHESPLVPALRLAHADALAKAHRASDAESAYKELLGVDPTFALAHAGLAEVAEKRDPDKARRHIIQAMAYAPGSPRVLGLARRLGATRNKLPSFAIFLDVDSVGAIHVGTEDSGPQQMYAACRAMLRYEPEVRAVVFEEPKDTPYYASLGEEVVCIEAALGAYLADRASGDGEDEGFDELLEVARDEGLAGFAMVEILGPRRPERARTAPDDVHKAMAGYIEHHVMTGERDDDDDGDPEMRASLSP